MNNSKDILKFRGNNYFQSYLANNSNLKNLCLGQQLNRFRELGVNTQTSFFRETANLHRLKTEILPSFKEQKIRIASIGCSDGRSLYSILLSNWEKRDSFILQGYDINPQMIKNAKEAFYTRINISSFEEAFSLCCEQSASNAFIISKKERNNYTIKFTKAARKQIQFCEHDILSKPLSKKYDIILLENVLMHYKCKGRSKILKNISKSLSNGGWLLCENISSFGPEEWQKEYTSWMEFIGETGFKCNATYPMQNYQKSTIRNIFPINTLMYTLKQLKIIGDKIDRIRYE